jgi:hypothetical protein
MKNVVIALEVGLKFQIGGLMKNPRDLVRHLEENPPLPKGDGEIASVYGVESCSFASGDMLCSRHVLASSFGPAYTAIWHCDPQGDWHFYQNVPPRQGCARFFGKALADITVLRIEGHWDGADRMRIVAPGRIDWRFNLSSTVGTRAVNLMGSLMPDALWKNPMVLDEMAPIAGIVLGAGKLRLTGRAPNNQKFLANPLTIWKIPSAEATIDGRNLRAFAPLPVQRNLGDFWVPRSGLFAIGRAFFDAFDPEIHSAATNKTESKAPDSASQLAAA